MPPTNRPSSAANTMISAGRTVRLKPMAKDNASAPSPDASATDPPPPVSIQPNPAAIPSTANRPRVCRTTSSTVSRSLPAYIRSSSSTPGVGAPKPAPLVNAGLLDRRMAMAVRGVPFRPQPAAAVRAGVSSTTHNPVPVCRDVHNQPQQCPRRDSNPHWSVFKTPASAGWATGATPPSSLGTTVLLVPQCCCWYHSVVVGTTVLLVPQRHVRYCLLYTSPSPRDRTRSRMPSSA